VTITNLGTNQKTVVKTSDSGSYSAPSLDPVTYSITFEASGFSKKTVGPVKVDTASFASVDVTLQAGAISTEVTISAEAAAVNAESGAAGTTVSRPTRSISRASPASGCTACGRRSTPHSAIYMGRPGASRDISSWG